MGKVVRQTKKKAASGTKRPIHQYPEEALRDALFQIRENNLSVRSASKIYGVPKTTIHDRLSGRVAEKPRKMGPPAILSRDEEKAISDWCINLAKCDIDESGYLIPIMQENKEESDDLLKCSSGKSEELIKYKREAENLITDREETDNLLPKSPDETEENVPDIQPNDKINASITDIEEINNLLQKLPEKPEELVPDIQPNNKISESVTDRDEINNSLKKLPAETEGLVPDIQPNKKILSATSTSNVNIVSVVSITPACDTNVLQQVLLYPKPIPKSSKEKISQKRPSAISSEMWRQLEQEKEDKKKKKKEEVQKRKDEARKKKEARQALVENRRRTKKVVKKKPKEKTDGFVEHQDENSINIEQVNKNRILCSLCDEELISDTEDNDFKNIGCDDCSRWYHLKCSSFKGQLYEDVYNKPFICTACGWKLI